ncbi:MAG: SOS response-associated peptidase [Rhodospirillales bacterium]|nr:SOS response-associated peptidase [Rhodospirillales bacterium]
MCARFELNRSMEEIAVRFGLKSYIGKAEILQVRPTNLIPVVIQPGQWEEMVWGIPAPWDGKPLINARSETLAEKKTFQPLLENRCLIPATAYFEWRKDGSKKHKNRLSLKDENLFAFAGLTDGKHVTIITCAPSIEIAHIHNRMPVILGQGNEEQWLDAAQSFSDVAPLLSSYPGDKIEAEEEVIIEKQPDLFD